ncbi:MAG: alpha-amylase family glycosyl hydrolase [Anaerolineae bacterium]|nr:alpha-amylase family glycosyl hydrolase [Anaerolineae bacterium]
MNEFIFGTLATSEKRLEYARQQARGVRHGGRVEPRVPAAGDEPSLTVTTELPRPIERVVCHILEPEAADVELQPLDVEWDLFNWSYRQVWRGRLPAAPDGTIVRYTITAYPADGRPVAADNGARFAYLVGAARAPAWAEEAIIYQIFPDRFHPGHGRTWNDAGHLGDIHGGTLAGIIENLDYVADLGFNCIWLNPFFPDATHHGYHATDYFQVNPRLGTLEEMRALVAAAHNRGIRLLLDFVANHWGSKHPTFQAALTDRDSEFYDWYTWRQWPDDYKTFFGVRDLPQINVNNPEARRHLLDAAVFWLQDVGFDGYRLDYALGPSHDFWVDFRAAVKTAKPDAWIFGEVVETPPVQLSYVGELDGTLDYLLMQALRDLFAFRTIDVAAFESFLQLHEAFFPAHFSRPTFLDNHDVNRFLWLTGGDKRRLKLAALCQFTLAGPPIVYYGTETGVSQERDIVQEHGHIQEEARAPMLWGDDQDTKLHDFYHWLVHFRRDHPVLWRGKRRTLHVDAGDGILAYTREDDHERLLIALNAGDEPRTLQVAGLTISLDAWSGTVQPLPL